MKIVTNPTPKDRYVEMKHSTWKIDGRINLDGEDLYVFYCDGTQFMLDPFELNNLHILDKVEEICQKYSLITEKPLSTKD